MRKDLVADYMEVGFKDQVYKKAKRNRKGKKRGTKALKSL